ncbi:MAG: distal tail protein Dit [Anaerotignaceae bacterium]
MATAKMGGFSFNGTHINNKDGDFNSYKLLEVSRPSSPNLIYQEFAVPNRDGSQYVNNRYEDMNVTVVVGVIGTATERQAKITSLLGGWMGITDRLIFDDRPTMFYKARIFEATTAEQDGLFTKLSITFRCSFALYELYGDSRDYTINQLANTTVESLDSLLINKSAWQDITARIVKTVVNSGNYKALPTIEIVGTATLLTIQINDTAFSIANVNGTVYVNCEKMICYTMTGSTKTSFLQNFTGSFPTINTGENTVIIDGTSLNLTEITVEYPNTYIV